MQNIIKLFTVILLLSSCEGQTTYEWVVTNSGSDSIRAFANVNLNYIGVEEYKIGPGESLTCAASEKRGGTADPGSMTQNLTEFYVLNSAGDTCTKDGFNENNWEAHTKHAKKIPSIYNHSFWFTVNDSDF